MFEWRTASNAIYLGEDEGGKGRQFKARFLVPGLVKYDYGVCLLTKENADKFINGFTGCPVVINHQTVTDKNVKDVAVGDIFSVWFDEKDGYYWCNGILRDKEAIKLIDEGYSVSCQYLITEYSDNTSGKLHNGNPYDKIIENGKPEHLAIVNNPRYEGAIIAVNAILAENEDKWITIHPNGEENKGRHLLLKDGESVEDAMHRNGWYKKRQAKETQKKDEKNQYLKKDDLETDKVYKLGNIYVKPFIDKDGDLAFYDKTGAWGEGSVPQKFLKSDLKNLERVEKYDKLTDKELKFLSEKGDFKEEKKERTFLDKKTGKEQSLKDLVEKGLTPVRYGSSLWDNKPSYGIGDGKIEYKITEEEYKQALEHQKDKKSSDLQKAKEQSKDLTDYIKWQYNSDIEPHITRRVGDKTLVYWNKLPRETQSALKRLDFDNKINLEQYSASEMSIGVKDKTIFENLKKHKKASNDLITTDELFVTEFKDALYTALAEGIVNRFGGVDERH